MKDYDITRIPEPQLQYVPQTLDQLDVDNELLEHYYRLKALAEQMAYSERGAPIMSSLNALLAQIVRARTALYEAERLKKLEHTLLKVLKTLPKTQQDTFMDIYARELQKSS